MAKLPLDGVRIVDFTQVQAGPQATLWLSVMGAEVIKIESRQRVELLRSTAPDPDKSHAFISLNFGKKSCTLNLTKPEAVELTKKLIMISDVVTENYSTGVMERFGLDYLTLSRLKPDLIMLSVSGLGRTGPDKSFVSYAPTIHAFSGMCSLTGYPDGPPDSLGVMWTDAMTAELGAFAVLSALHHRAKTGQGQYIDLAMSQTLISLLPEAIMDYTMNNRVRGCEGNRDDIMAPHGCYRCKGEDRWVAIAVSSEQEWQAFCLALGNPSWSGQERFSDRLSRWQNQDELDRLVEEWTKNYTPYEVMEKLQKVGVAAGPPLNAEEMANDPHLRERGLFVEIDHPRMGKGLHTRVPWKLGPNAPGNYEPAPLLGEHNHYVFHDLLRIPEDETRRLIEEKVIY